MQRVDDQIEVRSHVARDLLQSAGLFKTDKLVVWEYVSNGLQYVDPGVNPVVRVTLDGRSKRISISDNGRGMDWAGLQNFFVMHGENQDRRDGRAGRGRFGTGKSAAFGIADRLRITTTRNGRRSQVELSRADIEAMDSTAPVPVTVQQREERTDGPNGTRIDIEGIHLRTLDQQGIISYVERHLAHWSKGVSVFVNNHECEFTEPPVSFERRFRPAGSLLEKLGGVELVIKVAKAPLEEQLRGVAIYSNDVWHETTLAGSENREMAQYLFGELDVPRLESDTSPISPFDVSRSMQLNRSNELVQAIFAFIGQHIEAVRRELVEAEKQRRASEESRRLAEQASAIARVLNEDFASFRQQVARVRAAGIGQVDLSAQQEAGEDGDLVFGSEQPAKVVSESGGPGSFGGEGGDGTAPRLLAPDVQPADPEADRLGRRSEASRQSTATRSGFAVEFANMGSEENRARYVSDTRTILINLDHPQLVAARGAGTTDDLLFQRLSYEIAFGEYAIALASELAARGHFLDVSDPIVEIREALNRVARRGAQLYSGSR